jgi:protein-arginine kinase activator protein McsA
MIRLCVDCKAILGHCCPHCGDTTHKPASTNGERLTCGACWKSFEQDSTTGGFCEACLEKRLARTATATLSPKVRRSQKGGINVSAFAALAN